MKAVNSVNKLKDAETTVGRTFLPACKMRYLNPGSGKFNTRLNQQSGKYYQHMSSAKAPFPS